MTRVTDEQKQEVLRLHFVEGLSTRRIAAQLRMARRTVRKVLSAPHTTPKPREPRVSQLAEHDAFLKAELAKTPSINAPAMLERLRARGYTGGISVLRERLRALRPKPHVEVFSHFETRPGERLEVDWCELGFVLPGVPRRVSAFVAVLVHSRMLFLTFSLSHAMGPFLRCMDRSLRFFGGRASVDVFDNMKTVVTGRVNGEPLLHPTMVEYARVHGFAVSPTKPRHPTGKPFVERGIGFIRSRFLSAIRFSDLATLERDAVAWRDTFANTREHATTGKVPTLVFEHVERHALAPLREVSFDTDDVYTTHVGRTHEIRFDRNVYSVPWRLVGQRVLVRADDRRVRVLLGAKEVANHPRSWSVGELVSDPHHEDGMREARRRAREVGLPGTLGALGAVGEQYFALLAASRRSIRLEEQRLVLLAELFGASATASAMSEVLKTGHVGAEYVEHVMRFKRRLVAAPPPLRLGKPALDDVVVREPDLAFYDDLCSRRTADPGEPHVVELAEKSLEGDANTYFEERSREDGIEGEES
jgi:transposase